MSSSRTFVFDSADLDLPYEEVEAAFYSTDESDSNLSSSTSSSADSDSSDNSDDSDAPNTYGREHTVNDILQQISETNESSERPSRFGRRQRLNEAAASANRPRSSSKRQRRASSSKNDSDSEDGIKSIPIVRAISKVIPGSSHRHHDDSPRSPTSGPRHSHEFARSPTGIGRNKSHRSTHSNSSNPGRRSHNSKYTKDKTDRDELDEDEDEDEDEDDDDDSMGAVVRVTPANGQEPPGIMIRGSTEIARNDSSSSQANHMSDDTIAENFEPDYNLRGSTLLNLESNPVSPMTSEPPHLNLIVPSPQGGSSPLAHSSDSGYFKEHTSLYGIQGVGTEHFSSTHAFPTLSPSANNSSSGNPRSQSPAKSDGGDVVIEEPVRRRKGRSGGAGGDPGNGDDSDGNGGRKNNKKSNGRKSHKKKKSRRRYSNSIFSATAARRRAGWEPGVDIKTTDVILHSIGSSVTIVDYNETRYRVVQTEVYPEKRPEAEEEEEENTSAETQQPQQPAEPLPTAKWWQKSSQSAHVDGVQSQEAAPAPTTDSKPQVPPTFAQFPSSAPDHNQNKDFYHHLDHRPEWSSVRWISVNGLSWETISAISQKYNLHRLSIEDMIDIPQRTKVDIYPNHTFCVLPMHKLMYYKPENEQQKKEKKLFKADSDDEELKSVKSLNINTKSDFNHPSRNQFVPANHTKTGGMPVHSRGDVGGASLHRVKSNASASSKKSKKHSTMSGFENARRRALSIISDGDSTDSEASENESAKPLSARLAELPNNTIYDWNNSYVANLAKPLFIEKKRPLAQYRRAVGVEQVSLFLTDQKTVITFFEHSAADIERPLLARLATKSTMLRESCDPSMLLQAVMDIIVDQVQPIITAYRRRLTELEVNVMVTPTLSHTQDLHFMAAELSLLRNNIAPITSLIQSLRDHGSKTPTVPVSTHILAPITGFHHSGENTVITATHIPASASNGYGDESNKFSNNRISAVTKVYLADVADHLLSYTLDLDVMRGNTKNMIDMIFNVISIKSSDSVNQLSMVSVIFLPLSFWTGYFGMNFHDFAILNNSASMFWTISIPFSVVVLFLVMIGPIVNWYNQTIRIIRKRWIRHQRRTEKKALKKAKKRD